MKSKFASLPALTCALLIAGTAHGAEDVHVFSIAEQPLASALVQLSTQADIAIFAPADLVRALRGREIKGAMTPDQALTRLLADTGLIYARDSAGSFIVSRASTHPRSPASPSTRADIGVDSGDAAPEVLVTAQKRAQNAQAVPISMAVLNAEDLRIKGISDLGGALAATSSFTITPYPGSNNTLNIFMRGQGNRNPAKLNSEGGVGIYVDGFFIARSNAQTFDLADIERIEVLRGPQGTLYGKNTTGGAINVLTRAPKGELDLRESLDVGNRNRYRTLSTLDLPAWNDFSAKISVLKSGIDGYVKNAGPSNDFGLERQTGARAQLRWAPAEAFRLDYAFDTGEIDSTPTYVQRPTLNGRTFVVGGKSYVYFADQEPMSETYRPMDLPLSEAHYQGHGLTASWNITNNLQLKSLTSYRTMRSDAYQNYNEVFGTADFRTHDKYDHRQKSQEFQLIGDTGRISYVGGLYYFAENGTETNASPFNNGDSHSDSRSYAVFGQGTWRPEHFDDRVDLTLGARLTRDERAGNNDVFTPTGAISRSVSDSFTFDSFDPALTVTYHWSDDVSTYLKGSTAYRSGGLYFGYAADYRNNFAPERLVSMEIGLKSQWLQHRLLLNLAAFSGTLKDMQFDFVLPNNTSTQYNAGKARMNGVDVELRARPMPSLSLQLDYTFLDARLIRVTGIRGSAFDPAINPACGCQLGDDVKDLFVVPRSPRHSGTLGADYSFPQSSDGVWSGHVDFRWQSEHYNNGPGVVNRQYARFPTYGLVNARFGYSTPTRGGGQLIASLWGRNLLNKAYPSTLSGNGQSVPNAAGPASLTDTTWYWAEPRTYGVSLSFQL